MRDLQKMPNDKLDLFIEQIKKELDGLEFKLQVGSVSGFSYGAENWNKYYYFLTVLLQEAKEEKKRRTKNDSKRINKRTTKD